MYSLPADYAIDLPSTKRPVSPLVYKRYLGFEVRALKAISYHAAREMHWGGGVSLPASGYLFLDRRGDEGDAETRRVVVGAAFFERGLCDDVAAEWFLSGVWLYPAARCRGHFTRALPEMEAAFGHFAICEPYSDGFKALMARRPRVAAHAVERLRAAAG